jgi:hypothetical protein
MLETFSTPRNRTLASVFLALCLALAIAAVLLGVTMVNGWPSWSNWRGVLLGYLAAVAGVLAFVHPWRSAPQFQVLYVSSPLALLGLGIVAIVLDHLARLFSAVAGLHGILQAVSYVAAFLLVWVCPAAFFVGVVGALTMFILNRCRPTAVRDAAA